MEHEYTDYVILSGTLEGETIEQREDRHERLVTALHDIDPGIAWSVRAPHPGEAEGTYGREGGQMQILGYSIPAPERIEIIIQRAWALSIE